AATTEERFLTRLLVGRVQRQFAFFQASDHGIGPNPPYADANRQKNYEHRADSRSGKGNGESGVGSGSSIFSPSPIPLSPFPTPHPLETRTRLEHKTGARAEPPRRPKAT